MKNKIKKKYPSGEKSHAWKGGRVICIKFIVVYNPKHPRSNGSGYVMEHRLKMEKKLGRYLTKDEVIHHKDSNGLNNDLRNLILFNNNGEHISFHHTERKKEALKKIKEKCGKNCRGCRKFLKISEFTTDNKSRDGYRYECRECRRLERIEYKKRKNN